MSRNGVGVLAFALGSCGLFGQHSPTWDTFFQEGKAAVKHHDYSRAEQAFESAVSIATRFPDPDLRLAKSLNNLAYVKSYLHQSDDLEPLLDRAIQIWLRSDGESSVGAALGRSNLAEFYLRRARFVEAEQVFRQSLSVLTMTIGKSAAETLKAELNLGFLYRSEGRYREAEVLLTEALAVCQRSDPHSDSSIVALNNLGDLYRAEGKFERARQLLMQALRECEVGRYDGHPFKASILTNLAQVALDLGELARAQTLLDEALSSQSHATGSNSPELVPILRSLADVFVQENNTARGMPLARKAVAIAEQSNYPGDLAGALATLASVYATDGKFSLANEFASRAMQLAEHTFPDSDARLASILEAIGSIRLLNGDYGMPNKNGFTRFPSGPSRSAAPFVWRAHRRKSPTSMKRRVESMMLGGCTNRRAAFSTLSWVRATGLPDRWM